MAPIPTIQKNRPQQPRQVAVSTDDVYDGLGRTLTSLQRRQKRTDSTQTDNITVNRQHAQQYESKTSDNKLIYRDVFPGRKYKLTLSDTTWMGGANVVTVGYTVGDTFTQLGSWAEAPEDNIFDIEIPSDQQVVDTLEVRLIGASDTVRGYIEDTTTTSSIKAAIIEILEKIGELISGQESLEGRIQSIEGEISSLDERVTALEQAQPSS